MIPKNNSLDSDIGFEVVRQPSKTYNLDYNQMKVIGYTDGKEALKQSIDKIIYTQRYDFAIYSWNYGIEWKELIGKSKEVVYAELERIFSEALLQDDRIIEVGNFEFNNISKRDIQVRFVVKSIYGDIETETVVENVV